MADLQVPCRSTAFLPWTYIHDVEIVLEPELMMHRHRVYSTGELSTSQIKHMKCHLTSRGVVPQARVDKTGITKWHIAAKG
ncbi:hypothetical protein R1flu_027227 [Riccia fluitans]|uniref:Uncharacterized protein n=1 Tax=Riccia fluitans TaxID=41844 RepID=A0ABD1XIR5_9MARC